MPRNIRERNENDKDERKLEQMQEGCGFHRSCKEIGKDEGYQGAAPCPQNYEFTWVPLANRHLNLPSLARLESSVDRSSVDLEAPCTTEVIESLPGSL